MNLQELKPHLEALSQEDKLEAMKFLREVSTTEEELKAMAESDRLVREYFEQHPEEAEKYAVYTQAEAGIKLMEFIEENAKAKV